MVEKAHTAAGAGWWPSIYGPLQQAGQKIADFFAPQAEAAATDEAYQISIELPGVTADNIDVSVNDNVLTIKGEKRSERTEKGKTYFFSEREYGSFQRSFRLPADAQADKISADFKDGVLDIMIAKEAEAPPEARKISVRQA